MKEVKFNDLSLNTRVIILFSFISLIILTIYLFSIVLELKEELKQVPHKVCVNETILGEYLVINNSVKEGFDITSKNLICNTECINTKCLHSCQEILEIKEVCKWVDSEGNELKRLKR